MCIYQYSSLFQVYFPWLVFRDFFRNETEVMVVIMMMKVKADLLSYPSHCT